MDLKTSASLILLRPSADGFEVLLIKRSANIRLGNFYVFPGGLLESEDSSHEMLSLFGAKSALSPFTVGIPSVDMTALKVCAIRETYEETGILLDNPSVRPGLTFREACRVASSDLSLSKLQFFYRIITPLQIKFKYDTSFFLAEIDPEAQVTLNLDESLDYTWVRPIDALNAALGETLKLMHPQIFCLFILSHFSDIQGLLKATSQAEYIVDWPELIEDGSIYVIYGDYRLSRTPPQLKQHQLKNYYEFSRNPGRPLLINPALYSSLFASPYRLGFNDGQYIRLANPRL